ncbi:Serine/threonine-protein kinase TOR, partial [Caligus rogercresseyi]
MHRFVADLKSRHEETRIKGAKDLYNYVSGDLREVSAEELNSILDDFNHSLYEMMVSGDSSSKMGGILAIMALLNADVCNTGSRIHRFGNYLQNNCLPGGNAVTDPAVIALATKAIGRLTQ